VATHGWQQVSAWTPVDLGKRFSTMGVIHALYTDVSRDGDLSGVNVEATAALARETRLSVIASGGVASLDDVRRCRETGLIAGVIIGKALYSGAFALEEAIRIAAIEPLSR
jgi:phosphoribosylformimino-5-aminoimidazole carboxamide ribotide isomerase